MKSNKNRTIRIERNGKSKVHEDDNQHLWAVSYSDFLMVLLSFFILFYSADEDNRESLVQKISNHFALDGGQVDNKGKVPGSRIPASFKEEFPELSFEESNKNESLYIHFPENFFASGEYDLGNPEKEKISEVLNKLKPMAEELFITFEGHSDQSPITYAKQRHHFLSSNFVLSSMRATSALEVAQKIGFKEDHLFVSAYSSNKRNSRSLTIRITQRGVSL